MKKLIAAAPVVLAAALSLAACAKHDDAATNDTTTNEQVLGGEGPLDANAAGDNGFAPDDIALNGTSGNGANASISNAR